MRLFVTHTHPQVLTNKIADRKRKKAEKLAEKQKLEVDKLLVDQAAAREELELSQVRRRIQQSCFVKLTGGFKH